MDYQKYTLSVKEKAFVLICGAGITGCIALLFYESLWACLLFPVISAVLWRRTLREKKQKRQQQLSVQFLDAMRAVSASLLSGYSMENAWREAQKEVGLLHGSDAYMSNELAEINRSVALSVPIEKLLAEFGVRSGVEDIQSFAEVFSFAKWMDAFRETGVDPDFYAHRRRGRDEILPWDFVDSGISKEFLWREKERAERAQVTRDCRQGCNGCGLHRFKGVCGLCE